jgi:hypothetical protein
VSWTYAGEPGTATAAERRDYVRFTLGDTESGYTPTLSDGEIAACLSASSDDVSAAALQAGKALLARFARQADVKNGATSVSASQRYKALKDVVASLESDAMSAAVPYLGGSSKAAFDADRANTDLRQPLFTTEDDTPIGLGSPTWPPLVS